MEHPIVLRCISALGLCAMVFLAWLLSEKRSRVSWRVLLWGLGLQLGLGILVLRTPFGEPFFTAVRTGFDCISEASATGAAFVFGNLTKVFLLDGVTVIDSVAGPTPTDGFAISAVMAFQVLPVIIFVAGLSAVLQHLGVIQKLVRGMAWVMRRTMKTSGAETFGAALLVFSGIESISALDHYLKTMTRSEVFTLMVGFLATIAASVMVAYASFGAEPGHLMAASLMSAPAALVMAKWLIPETKKTETSGEEPVEITVESHNVFDAASNGAALGLNMALHVAALLIVFVGMIHLCDQFTVKLTSFTLAEILGYFLRPLAFLMGAPHGDIKAIGELLATKSVFNEFLAYQKLQPLISEGVLSKRGAMIATYALCGFANPGSVGILIGALSGMVPERRSEVAQMCLRAFIGGSLAAFMTACVAGMLVYE